jgi:dehydrogenase/reductase SDR family member 7B
MFAGKIWWITGASSGIGEALAAALAAKGANLILSGRNVEALEEVAKRCSGQSLVLPFEATDFAAIPAIVDRASDWSARNGGAIYGLVNNAGISQRSLAVDTVFDVYRKIIDVDLMAPIALTQA